MDIRNYLLRGGTVTAEENRSRVIFLNLSLLQIASIPTPRFRNNEKSWIERDLLNVTRYVLGS